MPATVDREPGSRLPLVRQFRFDAGTAALNLLATRGLRASDAPVERLDSVPRLREWLAACDLPAVPVGAADLEALRHLREAGYLVLSAVARGNRPPRAAVRRLGQAAARPLPGPTLAPDGEGVRLVAARPVFADVLTGLARDLAAHAADDVAALRMCAADGCSMVYLDRSQSGRRRWCSMGRCGNTAKASRHRARAAMPDGSAAAEADRSSTGSPRRPPSVESGRSAGHR